MWLFDQKGQIMEQDSNNGQVMRPVWADAGGGGKLKSNLELPNLEELICYNFVLFINTYIKDPNSHLPSVNI